MIRVIVVDDSALVRQVLSDIINQATDLEVVATAADPYAAREKIKALNPDVITLDVEMPRMDGLDFLEKIMRLRPMPVVMVSSLTEEGSETTLRALELGAVDFVSKPRVDVAEGLAQYSDDLHAMLRVAARARIGRHRGGTPAPAARLQMAKKVSSEKLILVGASTGGTEAIREFLQAMPAECPAILITQHMPGGFTRSFAQRLNGLCQIAVSEAVENERVRPGHAYIAPGGKHMRLRRDGADYVISLGLDAPVNRHRPSVDVLFESGAGVAGANAVAVIMTGMGDDGARGMAQLHQAGATTLAQDEKTCVVFGMPREAIELGVVERVLPLRGLASAALKAAEAKGRAARL